MCFIVGATKVDWLSTRDFESFKCQVDHGGESNGNAEGGNWRMQGHISEEHHGLQGKHEPEFEEIESMKAAGCALLISKVTM